MPKGLCDETTKNGKNNANGNATQGNHKETDHTVHIVLGNQIIWPNLNKNEEHPIKDLKGI